MNGPLASLVVSFPFANSPDREKDVSPIMHGTLMSLSDPHNPMSPHSLMLGWQGLFSVPPWNSLIEGLPQQSSDLHNSCSFALWSLRLSHKVHILHPLCRSSPSGPNSVFQPWEANHTTQGGRHCQCGIVIRLQEVGKMRWFRCKTQTSSLSSSSLPFLRWQAGLVKTWHWLVMMST